jgi:hypothetical protein
LETDSLTVELTPPDRAVSSQSSEDVIEALSGELKTDVRELLGLFVVRVLAAGVAKLRELEAAGGRLLVLRR